MKSLEWHRFFRDQREQCGKLVFTMTELANAAQASPQVLNVELSRLAKRGLVIRYARGRYGGTENVAPEDVLPYLDSSAYITGLYALHRHNLVNQVPSEITCFTNRRHNRSRERSAPIGRFVFVCVNPRLYSPPVGTILASPEQALCDFLHLTGRKSLRAETLVTFRNLDGLAPRRLRRILSNYPSTVARALQRVTALTLRT